MSPSADEAHVTTMDEAAATEMDAAPVAGLIEKHRPGPTPSGGDHMADDGEGDNEEYYYDYYYYTYY